VNKEDFRKRAKEIRKSLDMEKISGEIIVKIKSLDVYKKAQNVMIFYPLKNEINLLPLLKDNKDFYLPKIKDDNMLVCPYKIGDKMSVSSFKTQEPTSEPVNPEILDIIFIPALMVDKNFHRLGYGKGFYDRFLGKVGIIYPVAHQQKANPIKIVPIPSELITDKLPADDFDKTFDIILSEI